MRALTIALAASAAFAGSLYVALAFGRVGGVLAAVLLGLLGVYLVLTRPEPWDDREDESPAPEHRNRAERRAAGIRNKQKGRYQG